MILGIGKTRFFALVKEYKKDPSTFSVDYFRKNATHRIALEIEDNIMAELAKEKKLIDDPQIPLRSYNYSYIKDAQKILGEETHRYNYKEVHSTTGEIPYLRFQRALKEKVSLFRPFSLLVLYKSTKDIFALRLTRTLDACRKISINNIEIKLNGSPRDIINVHIYPLNSQISEVRFWCDNQLIDIKKINNNDLKIVHF